MMMLEQFTVENFKAFKHLELKDLGHINIFVGDNNVGKTCLLQAIGLNTIFCEKIVEVNEPQQNKNYACELPVFLDIQNHQTENLFYNNIAESTISFLSTFTLSSGKNNFHYDLITRSKYFIGVFPGNLLVRDVATEALQFGIVSRSSQKKADISMVVNPIQNILYFPAMIDFLTLATRYYSRCIDNNKDVLIIKHLQEEIEPRLTQIVYNVGNQLKVELQGLEFKCALSVLGTGFNKVLGFATTLFSHKSQYLFLDEPENGFHYKTQTSFWKLLANWSLEGDKQSFIATHSYELISNLNDLLTADPTLLERGLKVRVHRLERDEADPEKINVITMTEEGLSTLIAMNLEIR